MHISHASTHPHPQYMKGRKDGDKAKVALSQHDIPKSIQRKDGQPSLSESPIHPISINLWYNYLINIDM